jgi:nitroreductase
MELLEGIQTRNSVAALGGSAPDEAERREIFRAALRAPDHAWLTPWRFISIEGEARERLGEGMLEARQREAVLTPAERRKYPDLLLRAPWVIVVVARLQVHPKVPEVEQMMSAAAATQNILLACHALGYGAIWRTGDLAYSPGVKKLLGLGKNEAIAGFVYVGEAIKGCKKLPDRPVEDFVDCWAGD